MFNYKKVLMLFAHPDDEILAAGGTIHRLTTQGVEVSVCITNTGVYSRKSHLSKEQMDMDEEFIRFKQDRIDTMSILGVKEQNLFLGFFPDNEIDKHTLLELIYFIEKVIDKFEPDAIITHHRHCINIDHQYLHEAAVVATRPLSNRHIDLFAGEVLSNTGYLKPISWEPNFYVEISQENLNKKILAMQTYKGKARSSPHPHLPEVLKALAILRGSDSGYMLAEAFVIKRLFSK